jgi:hypothetical protein
MMNADLAQVHRWSKDLGHDLTITVGLPHAFIGKAVVSYFDQRMGGNGGQVGGGGLMETGVKVEVKAPPPIAKIAKKKAPPLPPNKSLRAPPTTTTTTLPTTKTTSPPQDSQAQWRIDYPIHAAACGASDQPLEAVLLELLPLDATHDILHVVNQLDSEGWSPLHRAAWNGQADAIRLLLAHGADPKVQTNESVSDVNSRILDRKTTPLHFAAGMGHEECVSALLKCPDPDAIINLVDVEGWTPLIVAQRIAADVNFRNQQGLVSKATWASIYRLLQRKKVES